MWDYAPGGVNHITGKAFGDAENLWVASGPRQVGKVVKKAIYREYTDATFTQLKPRPKEWEHLGFLGPLLKVQVGDVASLLTMGMLTADMGSGQSGYVALPLSCRKTSAGWDASSLHG